MPQYICNGSENGYSQKTDGGAFKQRMRKTY